MNTNVKKKMLIVLIAAVAFILVLTVLLNLLSQYVGDSPSPSDTTDHTETLKFSEEYVTDEAEFWSDAKYLAANRAIYHHDPQTGVTVALEKGDYDEYGAPAELICNLIGTIIQGDADGYNAFFSDIYFETNEKKSKFSMQKLYDILITPYSETKETDETGEKYNEYIYAVEYKIRRNNGSFRSDVDSDGVRTQYFLITDRSGALKIDGIYTYTVR